MSENPQSRSIAALNDHLRQGSKSLGKTTLSQIVSLMLPKQQDELILLVGHFDNFNEDNDPHGEHDFGSFDYQDHTYFWKIDYYDLNYEYYSEDSSNPELTRRVLMIMHSSEY